MRKIIHSLFIAGLFLPASSVFAADITDSRSHHSKCPSIQIQSPDQNNEGHHQDVTVSIQASATKVVNNDEAAVYFSVIKESQMPKNIRHAVDLIMSKIQERLKRERVTMRTVSRKLTERRDSRTNERSGWTFSQTTEVTTKDISRLAGWIGDIEEAGAEVQSIQYRVSDALISKTKSEALSRALLAFLQRARDTAKGLGYSEFILVNVQTVPSFSPSPVMLMNQASTFVDALSKVQVSPTLHSGKNKVVVNVSGNISLPYRVIKSGL